MKVFKRQVAVIIVVIVTLTLIVPIQAFAVNVGGREVSSSGACIIDFDTGIMLYGHEADTPRVPASMTKLVTAYVVYDAIRAEEISIDDTTQISQGVSDLSYNLQYSNVPLPVGSSVTIRELLDVSIIMSACAATVALGEALYGSEEALVARMNEKVLRLGINAQFFDSYGVSAQNSITPRGMTKLTRYLILNYPEILEVASRESVTFSGVEYKNTNLLLGEYTGADGLKTGFTNAAGFCFVGTAQRGDRRIIAVTMGSTQTSRFPDTTVLLDYGFANARNTINEFQQNSKATPSPANLILDGEEVPLNAYLIGGSHYFRLRDIALLMRDTNYQFDVAWSSSDRAVYINTNTPYFSSETLRPDIIDEVRQYVPAMSRFFLDGVEYALDVYIIEGSNYFRLRDFERLIGFHVSWIGETRTVIINTHSQQAA